MDRIKFLNWPFGKGEEVKLIQIGKPFDENGRWCIHVLFLSEFTHKVNSLKCEIGDARLLISNSYYIDGKYQRTDFDEDISFKIDPKNIKIEFTANKCGQKEFDSHRIILKVTPHRAGCFKKW